MAEQPSITCPRCGAKSFNPNDIDQGYCGRCHWWTSDPVLGRQEVLDLAERDGAIDPVGSDRPALMRRFAGGLVAWLERLGFTEKMSGWR